MATDLVSPRQLADYVGWPVGRVRMLIAKGAIRHVRIGGGFYLPKTAIEEYLAVHMVKPDHAVGPTGPAASGSA